MASEPLENSGSVDDVLVSPKLSMAFGPFNKTEFYVNYGRGFHSNDAKGTVIRIDPNTGDFADRAEPLVSTEGFDVGFRTTAVPNLQSTLTVFSLELGLRTHFRGRRRRDRSRAAQPSSRSGVGQPLPPWEERMARP